MIALLKNYRIFFCSVSQPPERSYNVRMVLSKWPVSLRSVINNFSVLLSLKAESACPFFNSYSKSLLSRSLIELYEKLFRWYISLNYFKVWNMFKPIISPLFSLFDSSLDIA